MKKVFYADGLFFFHRLYEFHIGYYDGLDDEECSTNPQRGSPQQ